MPRTPVSHARADVRSFLLALAGPTKTDALLEIRERHDGFMRCRFFSVDDVDSATTAVLHAAPVRDVYVGAAVRAFSHGGRAAVPWMSSLWIDADVPQAIDRLAAFVPVPSIVVGSGRGQHAYWLLDRPVDVDAGEDANRRLAATLAADPSCHDAARILRPPHTWNHGYDPPRPVRLLRLEPELRHALEEVVAALPAEPRATREHAPGRRGDDPLLALDPSFYVSTLLGVEIGRDRKVSCPFHTDEHPSLHVYPTPVQGWHCFSCRRGGSVYDLAAPLWGLAPRGTGFLRLRVKLRECLLGLP